METTSQIETTTEVFMQSLSQFSFQIHSNSKTQTSLQFEITYSLLDISNSISGSSSGEIYIDNQKKTNSNGKLIGIICGLIVALIIASIVVILFIKKKHVNKLPKEEIKQETTSIKTNQTEEKTVFHDNTDDDLNFWL